MDKPTSVRVSPEALEYSPTAGTKVQSMFCRINVKELRAAVAKLYNVFYREGKESQYTWEVRQVFVLFSEGSLIECMHCSRGAGWIESSGNNDRQISPDCRRLLLSATATWLILFLIIPVCIHHL